MLSAAIRARSAFVRRRRPLGPSITSSRETPTPLEPSKWTSILPSLSNIQTLRHAHARRMAGSAQKWQEVVGVALTAEANDHAERRPAPWRRRIQTKQPPENPARFRQKSALDHKSRRSEIPCKPSGIHKRRLDIRSIALRAFDPNGVFDELKKASTDRALNAEMEHHLVGDAGAGNGRRFASWVSTGMIRMYNATAGRCRPCPRLIRPVPQRPRSGRSR